jgi:NAD(P)-dependent dehydrogenase (short-subunit alcohol dehydrogenase family)
MSQLSRERLWRSLQDDDTDELPGASGCEKYHDRSVQQRIMTEHSISNNATFFLHQMAAKNMVEHGQDGAIVNMGSIWCKQAVQATPSSADSMAKAALHSLV